MADEATTLAVDAADLLDVIRESVIAELMAAWFGLPNHHRDVIDAFLATAVPIAVGAQQATVDATAVYVTAQLSLGGEAITGWPDYQSVTGAALRGGVPPSEVYARPFVEVWSGLDDGLDLDEAIERGATRLREIAEIDLQLAHDHAARDVMTRSTKAIGFRRVLVGARNCALCIVASTQRYHKRQLKKMHPGCNCKVAPVFSDDDRLVLDEELLEAVHAEIAAKFGISDRAARQINYRKILLEREHGEYGPVLTYASDRFTSFDDLLTPGRRVDRR